MNLTDLSWPAIKALAPDTPIVFPVAAIEQHGHHSSGSETPATTSTLRAHSPPIHAPISIFLNA